MMNDYFQSLIANCAVEWRAIPGYEGRYEASSSGNIRSVSRSARIGGGRLRPIRERILRQGIGPNGYAYIRLERRTHLAHNLVASAFHGMRNGSSRFIQVDHIDNNRLNNSASNLRYSTASQNTSKRKCSKWRGTQKAGGDGWSSYIFIDKERVYLGNFTRREDALAARIEYERRVLGDFSPIRPE